MEELIMIEELKFHLIHVSNFIFYFYFFLFIVSRQYNPNRINSNINKQMMFNPITNQPLENYKEKQEQIQKEREKEIKELYNLQQKNDKFDNNNINNNNDNNGNINYKKEQQKIPVEYNPYKHPYSVYQGHP